MEIMFAKPTHKQDLQHLHQQAFGAANSKEKGVVIGELVKSLLADIPAITLAAALLRLAFLDLKLSTQFQRNMNQPG